MWGWARTPVIEHLRRLGVTAVELLPMHHLEDDRHLRRTRLRNYWGYNTLGYFAPGSRATRRPSRRAVSEFKTHGERRCIAPASR